MKKLILVLTVLMLCVPMVWGQTSAIFYNGDEVSNIAPWSWGFSTDPYEVEDMGYTPGTPAIHWTGYNGTEGFQGIFLGLDNTIDLTADWATLDVKFKIKAPNGLPAEAPKLNVILYDSRSDNWDYCLYLEIADFQSLEDSLWHSFSFMLSELLVSSNDINKNEISAISFEYFDTGLDHELLIDEVYIGSPIVRTKLKAFDGTALLPGITFEAWGFDNNDLNISAGDGMFETNAIKWETSNWNWQGQQYSFDPQDMSTTWDTEVIEFFVKAPAGINDLSVGLYDADGNAVWKALSASEQGFDGNWKKIQFALKDMELWWDSFDNTKVTQIKIENASDGVTVPELLFFDYIGIGATSIEVEEPVIETVNMVFVNGKVLDEMYLWGGGFAEDPVEIDDKGYSPGTAAVKWRTYTSGSQYLFIGLTDNVGHDLSSIWDTDSVYFKMKAPLGVADTDSMDIVIYDSRNGDWEYTVTKRVDDLHKLNDAEWHQFSIALADLVALNSEIDKTDITAISFESSTGIATEIHIDKVWIGNPIIPVTMAMFNGQSLVEGISFGSWGFSDNSLVLAESEGYTSGTPAILWETSDWEWQGKSFGFLPQDFKDGWKMDTLKIKIKAPAGINTMAFRLKDNAGVEFNKLLDESVVTWDGQWQKLKLPLKSFPAPPEFNKTAVTEFAIIANEATIPERILIDDIWFGNPAIATDFTAPNPPASITVMADPSFPNINMILWDDVEGENDETYALYASLQPITDLSSENVMILESKIVEETGIIAHHLFYPGKEEEVTYYYAMTCTDGASNVSETFSVSEAFANTAKKRAIANFGAPENFELDGYFDEWPLAPFNIKPENAVVVEGAVDDSVDCTAKCYMALDDENLYLGFDVIDDAFTWSESNTVDWWNDESIEFFIGLYAISGAVSHHNGWYRGEEPDYRIVFTPEKVYVDAWPGIDSLIAGEENYYFESGGASDYYMEAKIPLAWMTGIAGDSMFTPIEGMKIPIEVQVNDADVIDGGTVARMQLGTNSSDDAWWGNPNIWTFTWVGMPTWTAVEEEEQQVALSYSLENNYPNPFNPTTTINYTIPKTSDVTLYIYNTLGQKVKTLVNQKQNAGRYTVNFDASNLASGLYFYQIKAGKFTKIKKMALVK